MPGPSVGPKLFRNEKKLFGPDQKRYYKKYDRGNFDFNFDLGKNVFYSIYADWTVGDRKSQFLGEGLMFSYILFWG